MASKYKKTGPINSTTHVRNFNRWVIQFGDDEESTINRKKYALMFFNSLSAQGRTPKILEETVIREISVSEKHVKDHSFRIDITDTVKLKMIAETIK